jgi:hypothetical protein
MMQCGGYILFDTPSEGTTISPTNPPVDTPAPTPVSNLSDVNNNGSVDIVDALLTAQHDVSLNPSGFNSGNADVNCDGFIDIMDALACCPILCRINYKFLFE